MHAQGFGAGSSPVVSFRPSLSPMLRSRRPKLTCRSTPVLASGCASFWSALHHDGLRHTGPHWAKRGTGGAHIIAHGCGRWLALDVNTLHCTARPAARAGGLFDAWGLHYNAVRRDIEAAKKTTKKRASEVRLGAARSLRQARNHLLVVKLKACLYPTSVYRCIGLIQWTREPHVGVAAGIRQRTTVREWCGIAATRPNPLCCLPLAREQCWADEDPFNLAPVSSNKVRGRIRCGWRTGGVQFRFFFFKLPS